MQGVDADGSGVIDYTEFLAATLDRQSRCVHACITVLLLFNLFERWASHILATFARQQNMKEDVCWAAFRVFDRNGDGHISKDELKQALDIIGSQTWTGGVAVPDWDSGHYLILRYSAAASVCLSRLSPYHTDVPSRRSHCKHALTVLTNGLGICSSSLPAMPCRCSATAK